MPKNRVYIILIVFILVFGVIMFLTFGVQNIGKGNRSSIFIVGDNTIWEYRKENWTNIRYSSSIDKLNWKNYRVYSDNKYQGVYQLWHDDKWYVFDKNRNALDISGRLFAYSSNYNINVLDFNSKDIDVDSYVEDVLKDNNISTNSFTTLSKTLVDIDGDGKSEAFYIASNAFSDDTSNNTFSFVFMVKDNKIYKLYNEVGSDYYDSCKPYFTAFLNMNGDSNLVILSCGKYSIEEEVNMLYSYDKDGFKIVISNQ